MKRYTVDTNIIVNLNRLYPRDIFPGPWESVEALIDSDRLCMCPDVLGELNRGGDDVHRWAKNYTGLVCEITTEEANAVASISNDHPGWVQGELNAADPWLVAHALQEGRTIITEEKTAGPGVQDKNQKVPNVAHSIGVGVTNFFGLARAESWQFK